MATLSVSFGVYLMDGDMLEDIDMTYVIHTKKQYRKAEMIAYMSSIGLFYEYQGYTYSNLIVPTSNGNDGITELSYYNLDTEEEYAWCLRVYKDNNLMPILGIVLRKALEKA